jgi:hypothetical protein
MGLPFGTLTFEFLLQNGEVLVSNPMPAFFSLFSERAASAVDSTGAVVVFSHDGLW